MLVIYILIICLVLYLWYSDFYILYNILPYKSVNNKEIKNVLIGIPTIDRDINKAVNMYETLLKSIEKTNNYHIDIVVITRESDIHSIDFWKNKCRIITVPHYEITGRHNLKKLTDIFNTLAEHSKIYDALIIIESDVYVKDDTISSLLYYLKYNHITFCYGNIPWNNDEPYVIIPTFLQPMPINPKKKNKQYIHTIGSWTGCVAIRSEVFTSCNFKVDTFNGINGQDVGFYKEAFKQRYKVFMLDEVNHDYK